MVYIKYKHIFRITLSVHTNSSPNCIRYFINIEFIYFCIIYYLFYTFVSQGHGLVNDLMLRDWTR